MALQQAGSVAEPKNGQGASRHFQHQQDSDSSSSATANLWHRAHGLLNEEDRAWLKDVDPGKLEILKDVLEVVCQRQDECLRKRWKFKRSTGEQIFVRDLFAKIARWIA